MKVLVSTTEDFIKYSKSFLDADTSAGTSVVLTVQDNSGFLVNDYIVVGYEGSEVAELQQITAITGSTQITIGTLKFAHYKTDPVIKYRYNKRKFYGCTTADGSFSELTSYGSPALIQVDNPQGTLIEYTGSEGYTYFKSTYFNSQTNEETDIGDAIATLADESQRYCSIYDIKRQTGLVDNPYITDGIIEDYRVQAENEVNSLLVSQYVLPLINTTKNVVEVPALVRRVTILLAGGYMDYREYGKDGEGIKWLGEARGILKSVQNGTQHLMDSNYNEFPVQEDTSGISSYPDGTGRPATMSVNRRF